MQRTASIATRFHYSQRCGAPVASNTSNPLVLRDHVQPCSTSLSRMPSPRLPCNAAPLGGHGCSRSRLFASASSRVFMEYDVSKHRKTVIKTKMVTRTRTVARPKQTAQPAESPTEPAAGDETTEQRAHDAGDSPDARDSLISRHDDRGDGGAAGSTQDSSSASGGLHTTDAGEEATPQSKWRPAARRRAQGAQFTRKIARRMQNYAAAGARTTMRAVPCQQRDLQPCTAQHASTCCIFGAHGLAVSGATHARGACALRDLHACTTCQHAR
jgi:hypothetical protein